MKKTYHHILELNLAILFISTSGPLGRYIELPVPVTIGLRALIAAFLIFLYCKWKRFDLTIHKKDRLTFLLSGVFMCLHWITYFYSLKLSNVAIGMISLFTYPVITAFLEPLLLKIKFEKIQFLFGLLVLIGIYVLVPDFDLKNNYSIALLLGVLSAVFYSLRNIITKSKVSTYNGSVLMFYQLLIIVILLSPFSLLIEVPQLVSQLPSLIVLAILTTSIGHTLFISSFKQFTTTSASIMSSSQPVYGILLGMVLLHEYPDFHTILGGFIILSAVLLESYFVYKKSKLVLEN